jgi:UDP-N-acetylmuramoyl-tripeptide--D-alanyl-D-alanine ligase
MMLLSEAARALGANWVGEDVFFESVGTDSRVIEKNQLFVALKGENFDGHAYAEQAIAQGAVAVMLSKSANINGLTALVVEDTLQALGALAAYWRSKFALPVVAITGSNGKTTVKEMVAAILRAEAGKEESVLATIGNLNNHIGLPMTLLKLREHHRYAVVEMGMNHRGEIRYLTHIGKPDVTVISNAGNAHLGELGSYEAIAEAKGEILEGLNPNGVAILNADDKFFPLWKSLANGKKMMSFGLQKTADIQAKYQLSATGSVMQVYTPRGEETIALSVPGLHNVMNALAAVATALALNVPLSNAKKGLENFQAAKGRLQVLQGKQGASVIDDTYNANPMSMKAAIDVLKTCHGKRILVLGDMGELGKDASTMHREIGEYAKNAGIDALFSLGELSAEITSAYGDGGKHYSTVEALIEELKNELQTNTTVLVKGSRFMAMERVVKQIVV